MSGNSPQRSGSSGLAEAADANLVAHTSYVQRRTNGMRVIDEVDLVLVDSGLACDTFNFVCRARLDPDHALERAHQAVAHFARVRRPFSWWVGPADKPDNLGNLLIAAGLQRDETELAMAVDLDNLGVADLIATGLEIRRVQSADELRNFARLNAELWTPPDDNVMRFYELAAPVLLDPGSALRFYVGYFDATPVATAELTIGGGVVGLYSISTVESHRRRGFECGTTHQSPFPGIETLHGR